MMLPNHFKLLQRILIADGYHVDLLETNHSGIVDEGLQNVHNDTCYPALLVIGQLMDAVKSGKYDQNKIALMITQTGGGCRASNYIHLLRKALKHNGLSHIPVVSFNIAGMEKNPGFKLTLPIIKRMLAAVVYADMLTLLANQTRPYELISGTTDELVDSWIETLLKTHMGIHSLGKNLEKIADSFDKIQVNKVPKIKVGVVGEIYIKYAPLGNNNLEALLAQEDCEVIVPGLLDFVIFMGDHHIVDTRLFKIKYLKGMVSYLMKTVFVKFQNKLIKAIKKYPQFRAPAHFHEIKALTKGYLSDANKMGEGWLLTGEMLELVHSGINNIICTQPFGCLPNHIVGKGMIRRIRENHPDANIVAIDYDPGATKINQENRIKLMLSIAKKEQMEITKPKEKEKAIYE